jgi:HEAT repeat protein
MTVLQAIDAPAHSAIVAGLESDQLYVRLHCAELCSRMGLQGDKGEVAHRLLASLKRPNALDRMFTATALGELHVAAATSELRRLVLDDRDPDVVRAAARALAGLGAKDAIEDLRTAMKRFEWMETQRDIAEALARLGDVAGIPVLLDGLDYPDDLIRESCFESFFAVTGKHLCYDPLAPHDERLAALSRLREWWTKEGGVAALRKLLKIDYATRTEVRKIAESYGGSDGSVALGDPVQQRQRLLDLGPAAVPGLTQIGLKYPAGWSDKRALICQVLGLLRDPDAAPALINVLRDPVIAVAAWSCDALGKINDSESLPAVQRYHQRLLSLASQGQIPAEAGSPDALIAMAASTCYRLGDLRMEPDLVGFLLSNDGQARRAAHDALLEHYGAQFDYDLDAPDEDRRAAVERWQVQHP